MPGKSPGLPAASATLPAMMGRVAAELVRGSALVDFFATAAKGTEPALRDELREFRFAGVRATRGGVHFHGDLLAGYRACLWSRVAMRVLLTVSSFEAPDQDALYQGVREVDWSQHLSPRHTLAVRAVGTSHELSNTAFIAQRTKDAVVDQLRERHGVRPSVNKEDPDVLISVHLSKGQATLYLDLAGSPLHLRGWRRRTGPAPLKETLAAAVLRLSGWDRQNILIDPMCGSGTIAIEAACWARHIAPGLSRERFGFERWQSFDASAREKWQRLREAARAAAAQSGPEIFAFDLDSQVLRAARANAEDAGVALRVERRDLRQLTKPKAAHIITNPPYGERLPGNDRSFREMAQALRALNPSTLGLLSGAPRLERILGRPTKWWQLYNGPLPCKLLVYTSPARNEALVSEPRSRPFSEPSLRRAKKQACK